MNYPVDSYKRYLWRCSGILGVAGASLIVLALLINAFYVDTVLKNKVYLLEHAPAVIFAGDSRAQRQLDPVLFSRLDQQKRIAVNIASESASVLSLNNLIDHDRSIFAEATVVVSISSNQINDGALDGGAYPEPIIARMSLWQQAQTFLPDHLDVLQVYYRRSFKYLRKKLSGRLKVQPEDRKTLGFRPIVGNLDRATLNADYQMARNPWLQGWIPDGFKWHLVAPVLTDINAKVGRLVVVVGPIAPSFRTVMAGTSAITNEREFEQLLIAFCRRLDIDCQCYSFDERFDDRDFYDPFHLNRDGAEKLTKLLMGDQHL